MYINLIEMPFMTFYDILWGHENFYKKTTGPKNIELYDPLGYEIYSPPPPRY